MTRKINEGASVWDAAKHKAGRRRTPACLFLGVMMSVTWSVSIYCPPMKIIPVDRKLKRTTVEPMTVTLTNQATGEVRTIQPVTIPETDVDHISIGHWRVKACEGVDQAGKFRVELQPEDVVLDWQELLQGQIVVIAKQVTATVWWQDDGGDIGDGSVIFPDCPVDVFASQASAVTATGSISF